VDWILLLPGPFHLGWVGLLLVLMLMALHRGPTWKRGTNVLVQGVLAVAVIVWAGATLSTIAEDHGPGLEVQGYTLRPPSVGPATLSLGTADHADAPLADPRADAVHAIVRWGEDGPQIWNASARRRLEIDGHGAHDVELGSGTRLLLGDGDLELVGEGLWPSILVRDGRGELHRYNAGFGRGLVVSLPGVGRRMKAPLGWLVLEDGVPVLTDQQPLPGTGPVARLELRGRRPWLTFPTPEDRADHAVLVAHPSRAAARPADLWRTLRGGEVLTLGYSNFVTHVKSDGALVLRGVGTPGRLPWPDEDARVFGDPGILAVGDADGQRLMLSALHDSPDAGFRSLGGVVLQAPGGASQVELGPGRVVELPWADGVTARLRTAARAEPTAALAGLASDLDRMSWRAFGVLAILYLLLAWVAAWSGVLHGRSAGVLHGAALLLAVGLICLYRLADPGDTLRAGWLFRQARIALVGLTLALGGAVWVAWRGRFVRSRGAALFRWLDGADGGGSRARSLYAVAVGVLVLQLPFGETGIRLPGIGSVQPIELARTLLVVYLAYWTARAIESKRDHVRGLEGLATRWSYMAHALPVVVVLGLCYGLDDISPILVFSSFLAVLYALSIVRPAVALWPPRAWRDSLGVELFVVALVLFAVGWLVLADPTSTVARRVAVWWDPWTRGGEAYQAVTALWTSASGGLWGLGWSGDNGLLPPAVQDDFILALLAARAGVVAVTLVAATFAVVLLSGAQALQARRLVAIHQADRERVGVLTAAVLWMIAIQAAVVLGSATGGLPVMGQPLPFVAAAGSHLLLFCIPAVALVLGATRIEQRVHRRAGRIVTDELPSIVDTWTGPSVVDSLGPTTVTEGGLGWSTHG
jgi:cell division protein FtsW (lipid II flippase)